MTTLVDTNVLLDLVTDDPVWSEWSVSALQSASGSGQLAINDIVYAELSVRFPSTEMLDAFLDDASIVLLPMPRSALFLAAKAFQRYRAAGGSRTGVLPDFFIGAHAAASAMPLLTRDAARYRSYFQDVQLVVPDGAPEP